MKILHKPMPSIKNLLLGAFLAFSGCFLNVHAMKRQASGDQDLSKKQKIEINTEINGNEIELHDLLPSWQDIESALSHGTLTSKMLEAYVRGRIDIRIAYWKKQYELVNNGHKADVALEEIPIYAIMYENATSYDLINNAFVYSDAEALSSYEKSGHGIQEYEEDLNGGAGFFNCVNKNIYLNDVAYTALELFAYYGLAALEHEITHAEQLYNGFVMKQLLLDKPSESIVSLTNKDALKYCYDSEKNNVISIVKNTDLPSIEAEADHNMIRFCPNLYFWKEISRRVRDSLWEKSHKKDGYLSHKQCTELMKKYKRENNSNFIEFMNHKKADIYTLALGQKRVKERLQKMGIMCENTI